LQFVKLPPTESVVRPKSSNLKLSTEDQGNTTMRMKYHVSFVCSLVSCSQAGVHHDASAISSSPALSTQETEATCEGEASAVSLEESDKNHVCDTSVAGTLLAPCVVVKDDSDGDPIGRDIGVPQTIPNDSLSLVKEPIEMSQRYLRDTVALEQRYETVRSCQKEYNDCGVWLPVGTSIQNIKMHFIIDIVAALREREI
jgi:hypothetical protein